MKALVAGGCFWGLEHLFKGLNGVVRASCGYAGGTLDNPKYEQVKTGSTGHAEAVLIEFDPNLLSYNELLQFFFRVHDPTTRNRQGNDIGSQYRSSIYFFDEEQKNIALSVIEAVNISQFWKSPVVTEVLPYANYYPAEEYHQAYLDKNPGGYTCHFFRERPQE